MAASAQQLSRRSTLALYTLWTLFCLLLIVTAVQDHIYDPRVKWWEPLLWEGSSVLAATGWLVNRRRNAWRYVSYLDRPLVWMGHQLKWLPLVALGFIGIVYSIRHGVYSLLGSSYEHEPWTFVVPYETLKLGLFMSLWLGVIFGFDAFTQWQAQREQLIASQKALAEAQLSRLKAQLRPHFLFNALNTISSLMHSDVEQADRLLAKLSDLLRASLHAGEQDVTPLREEIALLQLYAHIMQERFGERVEIQWRIDADAESASIPSLLLQPLLENAFKHGVEPSTRKESIRIEASRNSDSLHVRIFNTGSIIGSEKQSGIGLRNCRERLRVLYGDQAMLNLRQVEDGVQVDVQLPYREGAP